MRLLRCDADWAIVCMAGAHGNAADRLHGRIGQRNRIGPQSQRLDKISGLTQAPRYDQRNISTAGTVEMPAGAGQRRDCWHRNIVAEDNGGSAGTTAPAIKNDVVDTNLQSRIDIFFDMLRRQLIADRNAAGTIAHLIGEVPDLAHFRPVGKARRRDRRLTFLQSPDLGDFTFDLRTRKMPACSRFGALAALEVKGLNF